MAKKENEGLAAGKNRFDIEAVRKFLSHQGNEASKMDTQTERLRLRLRLRCISELVNTLLGQYPRRQEIRDAGQIFGL